MIEGSLLDLKSDSASKRAAAIKALVVAHENGILGERLRVVRATLEQLAVDDPDRAVRDAATEALKTFKTQSAIESDSPPGTNASPSSFLEPTLPEQGNAFAYRSRQLVAEHHELLARADYAGALVNLQDQVALLEEANGAEQARMSLRDRIRACEGILNHDGDPTVWTLMLLDGEHNALLLTEDYEKAISNLRLQLELHENMPEVGVSGRSGPEDLKASLTQGVRKRVQLYEEIVGAGNGHLLKEQAEFEMASAGMPAAERNSFAASLQEGKAGTEAAMDFLDQFGERLVEGDRQGSLQALDALAEHETSMDPDGLGAHVVEFLVHSYEDARANNSDVTEAEQLDWGTLLFQQAQRELRSGDYAQALADISKAASVYEQLDGTEVLQAKLQSFASLVCLATNRHEAALEHSHHALALLREVKDSGKDQAACLYAIGSALTRMGKYEEAREPLGRAIALHNAAGETQPDLQSTYHMALGDALAGAGEHPDAIEQYLQSLELLRDGKGSLTLQANSVTRISAALKDLGAYNKALEVQMRALDLLGTARENQFDRDICWGNIGDLLRLDNRTEDALTAYQNVQESVWWVSHGLALTYAQRNDPGDSRKAIARLLEAVRMAEEARSSVMATEHRAGVFQDYQPVFADCVAYLAAPGNDSKPLADEIFAELSRDASPGSTLSEAAFHIADRGKGRSLVDAMREKATLASAKPATKLLAEDQGLSQRISKLSTLREPLPDEDRNRAGLTQEIEALQQRRNMIEVELKKTALGDYVAPEFRTPMEFAKELEPDRAVLQYSVGEKDGWLLILTRDGVTAYRLGVSTPALPELLPRQEATLHQLAEAWVRRASSVGIDGLVRLARARAESSGKPAENQANFVDAAQEKAILEQLAKVVLPDPALSILRKKNIRRLLIVPDGGLHYVPFAMLRLKNAEGTDSHYLVEEFSSSYVPAMTTLDTIRNQSAERRQKRTMERRALLAIANPEYRSDAPPLMGTSDDMITRTRSFRNEYYRGGGLQLTSLPETEREAVRIASLFSPPQELRDPITDSPEGPAVVLSGRAASEEATKRLLSASVVANTDAAPRWKYLVFSTHGLADTYNGMLSCLALSSPVSDSVEDGFLQAQEVMGLDLDTDVVMLSACQTGLGRLRGGEGLVGLSAAFFYAGAESVCASLWQVPSGPTTQLVPEFFKHLEDGSVDRAEALRQAQLTVLREGRSLGGEPTDYSPPFCWAAFVLIGEYQ
ncbi:MAG: CHAT domain-containing protein [Candidatus Hydrogenedentes bacterium]|nr:CHAT domain-containing protein [Candidatus Hydrogenedentota bacterium]